MRMERMSLSYQNSAFGPDMADRCTLRVVIGPDGLSYTVKDEKGTIHALRAWQYSIENPVHLLRKTLQLDTLIVYPFAQYEVRWMTPFSTGIPRRMFDAEHAAEYLTTLTDQPLSAIQFEEVPEMDVVVISGLMPGIKEAADHFFPNALHSMQAPTLLRHFQKNAPKDDAAVFVHLHASYIQVAAFERGNLLFFNTFKYEKPSDVLYFTLLVYDQYFLKPTENQLFISGSLLKDAEIYRQYERFIRHIRFCPSPALPGVPDTILPHLYLDQTL